jgi:hypothetical protein
MNQTISSSLAATAFIVAVYATYTAETTHSLIDTYSPIAVLDTAALNMVYANSSSEQEVEDKNKAVWKQVSDLGNAGYIVVNTNGQVLAFPEEIRLTPEILGVAISVQ